MTPLFGGIVTAARWLEGSRLEPDDVPNVYYWDERFLFVASCNGTDLSQTWNHSSTGAQNPASA